MIGLMLSGCADPSASDASPTHAAAQVIATPDPTAIEAEANAAGSALSPTYDELSEMEGFDSGGLLPGTTDLEIYWHGPLSPEARASIERANERGQQVHVVEVKYTSQEIWNFATSLARALEAEDIALASFGTNRANDEISLSGPVLSNDARLQEQVMTIAAKVIPDDISITFVPVELDGVTYDARHSDTGNPTIGGELDIDGSACTGGLGTNRAGYGDYLLTAAHCVDFANSVTVSIPGNSHSGYSTFTPTLVGSPNSLGASGYQVDATLVSYVYDGASIDAQMFYGDARSN